MKRKARAHEYTLSHLGDEFVAEEILARLPACSAARCAVLSKRFRRLLTSPDFWLRQRRLGASLERPHVACFYRYRDGRSLCHALQLVGPALAVKHAVGPGISPVTYDYAGTCNGLVLLTTFSGDGRSIDAVVFNPATKEEEAVHLSLPAGGDHGRFFGFGYGPSSKSYKALACVEGSHTGGGGGSGWARLMVVPFGDAAGCREPRTVFSCEYLFCVSSLYTDDGKVYLLASMDDGRPGISAVLAFDVDDEVVANVALPAGERVYASGMILEIRGRPCVPMRDHVNDTVLWELTSDHRWERRCVLVEAGAQESQILWIPNLLGAWDCGGGFLSAWFESGAAYLYDLREAGEEEGGGVRRLAAASSWRIIEKSEAMERLLNVLDRRVCLWGYQPTLISPASVFCNAAFTGRRRTGLSHFRSGQCRRRGGAAAEHECNEILVDIVRKVFVEQVIQRLHACRRA